jgi:acetylglutamate kinase
VRAVETVVIKLGGSTLGEHDTSLDDLATLWRQGTRPVVIHGGGAIISSWLDRLGCPVLFHEGQRVTDPQALEVVAAVLSGLVNKTLVASLQRRDVPALGLSGADGPLLGARIVRPQLGLVGEVTWVNTHLIRLLLKEGFMPVVAPLALEWGDEGPTGRILNVNADLAAGAVAASLAAPLLLLTDVPGVMAGGKTLPHLTPRRARALIASGQVSGGMVPKVEAALQAAAAGACAIIADGRREGTILQCLQGKTIGTRIG